MHEGYCSCRVCMCVCTCMQIIPAIYEGLTVKTFKQFFLEKRLWCYLHIMDNIYGGAKCFQQRRLLYILKRLAKSSELPSIQVTIMAATASYFIVLVCHCPLLHAKDIHGHALRFYCATCKSKWLS